VNQSDGETVWETEVEPALPEQARVRDHGYAASTPATDGERLYVFFGKSGVFAFDLASGDQLWNTSVGTRTHGWGSGSSPVLYRDLVIVNASVESGKLVALNKKSGEQVWEAPGMSSAWNTPLLVDVDGGQELVVSVQGKLLGFDPASGEPLWNCRGIEDYVCPSVVARDGVVYACGGRGRPSVAVKAGGRGNVTETHFVWQSQANSNVPSPVLSGDHLYLVSHRGEVFCLDAETGDIAYQERLRDAGTVYASVALADDKLYIVTRNGGCYVVAAKPEFEELARNQFDDRSIFDGSPAFADGKIFLRSNKFLYCVGSEE
jgi:outer membrane protein assembly factor BamB